MDIYYMSDSIQYSSFRGPVYRDYEKFPYGTLENPLNNPVASKSSQQQQQQQRRHHHSSSNGGSDSAQAKLLRYMNKTTSGKSSAKDSCPFCKEQKKRPLGAYMRKRGQRITSESISEDAEECTEEYQEEEEQEEEEEQVCSSAGSMSPTGSPTNDHQHIMNRGMAGFNRQESIVSK